MPVVFLIFLWMAGCANARAADALQLKIHPRLPATISSVAQAASYYLEPAGYVLAVETPVSGDARALVFAPVPPQVPARGLVTIENALLHLVPAHVHLYVDHTRRMVAFGPAP